MFVAWGFFDVRVRGNGGCAYSGVEEMPRAARVIAILQA
jgi:hypothetical protein